MGVIRIGLARSTLKGGDALTTLVTCRGSLTGLRLVDGDGGGTDATWGWRGILGILEIIILTIQIGMMGRWYLLELVQEVWESMRRVNERRRGVELEV
jgi:hypothetical protein